MGDFDLRPAVIRVRAPVLILYGESDAIPLRSAQDWAASFPDARLLVVRHTGHLIHLEQPDTFFLAVERFLSGQWPAGAQRVEQGASSRPG
jgi:pimeloyl-ACP methyl ester carboxylesterase